MPKLMHDPAIWGGYPYCFVYKGWTTKRMHKNNPKTCTPLCGTRVDQCALEFERDDGGSTDWCRRCFREELRLLALAQHFSGPVC